MEDRGQMDESLRNLIEMMHFTEKLSTKMYGLLDEAEIYKAVAEAFEESGRYSVHILLLTNDGTKLRVAETGGISPEKLEAGEKASGLRLEGFRIYVDKSIAYTQVVREGRTLAVRGGDMIRALLPEAVADLTIKVMGYEERTGILTPLRRHGEIIGVLAMSSTGLAEHFIPSVRSLAQHISNSLDLAHERAERKRAEDELKQYARRLGKRVKEMRCLYGISRLLEKPDSPLDEILQGVIDLLPSAWQYPECTCSRLTLGDSEFQTANYQETTWQQTTDIVVNGEQVGALQICYLEERPESDGSPFLREERYLIDAVAERLGRMIERIEAQQALAESQERYRSLYDGLPVGVGLAAVDGRILACNSALSKMTGYTEEELSEINLSYMYRDPRAHAKLLQHLARDGFVRDFEVELRRKDGTPYHVSLTVTPSALDGRDVLLTVAQDVTRRKEVAAELWVKDRAIASSINGIAISDLQGILTYVNPSFLKMWGYHDDKEVLGRSALEFWREAEEAAEAMRYVLDGGSHIGELAALRKDGLTFDAQLAASIVPDKEGRPICMMGSFVDITERKRAQLAAEEERQRIAQGMHDGLAQDLAALLLGVQRSLSLLDSDPAAVRDRLMKMEDALKHHTQEVRRLILALRPLDLEELGFWSAVRKLVQEFMASSGLAIHVSGIETGPLLGREAEYVLFRVVQEALNNVRKHAQAQNVWLDLVRDSTDMVHLTMRDDGRGFDRAREAEEALARGHLGLVHMRERVEALGGRLRIESSPGRGTVLSVTLPVPKAGRILR